MTNIEDDEFLDRKSAAKYIGFTPGTLAVWDSTKRYDLKPIKVGRSVRYRKSYLDEFMELRLIKFTSSTTQINFSNFLECTI